jgi:sucrose 6(F)-phosphate phosphorylase
MAIKNQVQLITYPDSLGGDLKALNNVLNKYFPDVFKGGVHILPPFPSSGDRGFAPLTYLEIGPAFGTWEDIQEITLNHDVLLDLMVNHISRQSTYFQDFIKNGQQSEFVDLFITLDKIWPDGIPVQEDISKMFLRRANPYSEYLLKNTGETAKVWTTFGKEDPSEQIDFDINSAVTKKLLGDFLENFSKKGVKIVRLDAVGYIIKKLGTSCFFVEPEIFDFMSWITEKAHSLGLELLPEVHAHYSTQFKLAEKGYWIYDFILPYTILDSLINKSGKKLVQYLKSRPHKQFTMLDCHDGIPVKPDMDDLVSTKEARKLVDTCLERGANLSLVYSDEHKSADGFDVHQIRGSYYSLLNADDDAYIAARAIQFFTPGIPQVYYVTLLAGENDKKNVEKMGEGREINRHNFTLKEIDLAVQKPVVQRLLELIRFRNEHPAFNGEFKVSETSDKKVRLVWEKGNKKCMLSVNFETNESLISYTDTAGKLTHYEV